MTAEQLARAIKCQIGRAEKWLPHLSAAMARFHIDTPDRQAAFLAQIAHESLRLSVLEENLNYSAEALQKLFGRYFTPQEARLYARRPEQIANRIYSNRMGNGPESSGDGWRYRGRGPIQITGKNNYAACGQALGLDFVAHPELLVIPSNGALAAGWYWSRVGANGYADRGDFDGVSDLINLGRKTERVGDSIGYADRLAIYKSAHAALTA